MTKKAKKSMLKNLKIEEVTFCGVGMNQKADITLFKARLGKEEYDDGIRMFREVLAEMELAEQLEAIIDKIMTYSRAHQSALFSLLYNEDVKDKKAAIRENLQQYVEALNQMAEGEDFSKALAAVDAWVAENSEDGEPESLVKHITTINKEAAMSKELEAKLKKAEEAKKAAEEAQKASEKALAKANALAEMTDSQKDHYQGLKKAKAQDAFIAMTPEERDEEVTKAQKSDETMVVDGETIRKSEVGPGVWAFMKKQAKRADEAEKRLEKAEKERLEKSYQERAEKEYPNLPGSVEEKGHLMKALDSVEEENRPAIEKMLKAGNDALGKSFNESGHGAPGESKNAEEQLDKLAKAKAKDDGVSYAKAYDAVLQTPEGAKLYKESLQ